MSRVPTSRLDAELERRRLVDFVRWAWHLVDPHPLVWGPHLDIICDGLERISRGEIRRLLINVPPRHGKTIAVSVLFPAWLWLTRPETRFLAATYHMDLALSQSARMQRLIAAPEFQERYPDAVRLLEDQTARGRFETTAGGARVTTSVGGAATGEGGDILIVDDPLKIDDAHSDAQRAGTVEWFEQTFMSRRNTRRSAVIVIGQRLHEHDLFGHLLNRGGWEHICLPAGFDPDHPHRCPADPRRAVGEPLWPAQWTREDNEQRAAELGEFAAAAMLQQLPAPSRGGVFRREWWQYYPTLDAIPRLDQIVQSWDLALTGSDHADYVVGQAWGFAGPDRYLLRQMRGKMNIVETIEAINGLTRWITATWPHHHAHAILLEKAASADAVSTMLKATIPSIRLVSVQGNKLSRANAVVPMIQAGNVYLPGYPNHDHTDYDHARTPLWVQSLVEEHARFPRAAHDDQVDALSQALRENPVGLGQGGVYSARSMNAARDRGNLRSDPLPRPSLVATELYERQVRRGQR